MKNNIHFENLLNEIDEKQFIGLGNPNAKILFIGKEPGAETETIIYHGSAKSWKEKGVDYSEKYIPEERKFRNLNHTWQRYQKLYDCIISRLDGNKKIDDKDKYEINFVENVFTTELSNLHAPNSPEAKKQENFGKELKIRKNEYFDTDFIKQFPIIIIFASDNQYIETYPGEVCKLFNVKFEKLYDESAKDKIWIHSQIENEKNPRILIHTRQLTNRITSELIPNICGLIVDFIKENSIEIETK